MKTGRRSMQRIHVNLRTIRDWKSARASSNARKLRASGASNSELDLLHEQFINEALTAGVFGAPGFVLASGEIFWGQDRLELLERALRKPKQA